MGVLQDIFGNNQVANTARIFLRSAGAGIPEWAGRRFGNPETANRIDQLVARSRANAGFTGDVANVAGLIAPGAAALKGLRAIRLIPGAIRAAPEAIPAAARAARVALTNAGGPGLTRAEVAARLGFDYVPTLAERALNAAGRGVIGAAALPFKHPVITALTGAGALASYASRNGGGVARVATSSASPAAAAEPTYSGGEPSPSPKTSANAASTPLNPEFSQLAQMVASANDGKISLRELAALSDIAYKTVPRRSIKSPTLAEDAGQRALALGEQLSQARMAQAMAAGDKDAYQAAAQEQLLQYERLARARAIDPLGSYAYGMPEDDGY